MLGVKEFLDFAVEIRAIGDLEAEAKSEAAEEALRSSAAAQAIEQAQEDPVRMFVEGIPSVLASCRGHLTNKDGTAPEEASSLGWRQTSRQVFGTTSYDAVPQGDRIGWLVGEQVWLLPNESLAAVNRLLHEQGRSIPVSRDSLGKRLREQKWLIENDKDTFTKKVRIGAGTQRVFVFSRAQLFPSSDDDP